MGTTIDRIVDKLDIEQTEGIFEVPDKLNENTWIKKWLDKFRQDINQTPLVVAEENYYKNGIEVKLKASRPLVTEKLAKSGLIRPRDKEDFSYKPPYVREPVSTLSLAQTISWIWQKPIEEILVSGDYFLSEDFLQEEYNERLKTLFNAYSGCNWFELFRKRQIKFFGNSRPFWVRSSTWRPSS